MKTIAWALRLWACRQQLNHSGYELIFCNLHFFKYEFDMLSEEENKEKSFLKTELRCLGFNFQLHVNFTDGKFFEAFQWPYGNFTLVT